MQQILTLYHGSTQKVSEPDLNQGKKNNDYGQGFYCTEHYDLACEWAAKYKGQDGFANQYELDLTGLSTLDLSDPQFCILDWITILLQNRTFMLTTPVSEEAKEYLVRHFSTDTACYDVIKGYRADDSYFSFAEDFLNNAISVEHLAKAMQLGNLGIQYALVSRKAFAQLKYIDAMQVKNEEFYPRYMDRDLEARKAYGSSKRDSGFRSEELYMIDIIRGEIKHGDPRIP